MMPSGRASVRLAALTFLLGTAFLMGCRPEPVASPRVSPTVVQPPASPAVGDLARAGASVYAKECAPCHGQEGEGLVGPALWGPGAAVLSGEEYHLVRDLFQFIQAAMPQGRAGVLPEEVYQQLTLHILTRNGILSGEERLEWPAIEVMALQR